MTNNFSVDLRGKTALVTGAGAGVGKAIALALADAGANVAINDINPDRADSLPQMIRERGAQAIGFQGDIANRFQASAFIERTRDAFGRIDFAINAVGAFQATPFATVDEWDLRRQMEVNLIGTFFMMQLVSRVMTDEGGGVIVNIASSYAERTFFAGGASYLATKAGIIAVTRQAARELAPAHIRVNAVAPGNIEDDDLPTHTENMLARPGTPEDVAGAVLFLVSDAARFITGQTIHVDGGLL